jgi:hypothetical protein
LELLNSILRSTDFCGFSAMTLHIKATVERWPVEGHFTIARGAMHLSPEFPILKQPSLVRRRFSLERVFWGMMHKLPELPALSSS